MMPFSSAAPPTSAFSAAVRLSSPIPAPPTGPFSHRTVRPEPPAQRVLPARPVPREQQEPQARLAPQAQLEIQAQQVPPDRLEPLELPEPQVQPEPRVRPVQSDSRVLLDPPA